MQRCCFQLWPRRGASVPAPCTVLSLAALQFFQCTSDTRPEGGVSEIDRSFYTLEEFCAESMQQCVVFKYYLVKLSCSIQLLMKLSHIIAKYAVTVVGNCNRCLLFKLHICCSSQILIMKLAWCHCQTHFREHMRVCIRKFSNT